MRTMLTKFDYVFSNHVHQVTNGIVQLFRNNMKQTFQRQTCHFECITNKLAVKKNKQGKYLTSSIPILHYISSKTKFHKTHIQNVTFSLNIQTTTQMQNKRLGKDERSDSSLYRGNLTICLKLRIIYIQLRTGCKLKLRQVAPLFSI